MPWSGDFMVTSGLGLGVAPVAGRLVGAESGVEAGDVAGVAAPAGLDGGEAAGLVVGGAGKGVDGAAAVQAVTMIDEESPRSTPRRPIRP